MEKHPLHLKNPELQNSDEVSRAVERKERREETKIPNDPGSRIEAYTERLENIFLHKDEETRKRNIEMFRDEIYDQLISKQDVVIEENLLAQSQIAFEQGHGQIQITEEMKSRPETIEEAEQIIKRQKESLDAWIDYLSSEEADYPTWFKYLVWTNITKLQDLTKKEIEDKETGEKKIIPEYQKRNQRTLRPFPDIFRAKLARIFDQYNQYVSEGKTEDEIKSYFNKKFADTYAIESYDHIQHESREELDETRGEWVMYKQNDEEDLHKLVSSLEGKYTDWCTEGIVMAKNQLAEGNFYVYYSYDKNGKPSNPRIAIHCHGNQVGELRGIDGGKRQELEPSMIDIARAKVQEELGQQELDKFEKKSADMKMLTQIDKKVFKRNKKTKETELIPGTQLSKQELRFIYEIDSSIEGFGYGKDPRIEEILNTRNRIEDALTIFEITEEQLATKKEEVTEQTKIYIGELYPNIFKELPQDIEHIYTSFPEEKVYIETITIPEEPKTPEQYEQELEKNGMKLGDWGKDILQKADLTEGKGQTYKLIIPTVTSLGFKKGAARAEIQARAKELGFGQNLLPAITGPELRLQMKDQKQGEWILIDMEAVPDRRGLPRVFDVSRNSVKLWLDADFGRADAGSEWPGNGRWAFAQD
jgi:hypothetical protein